MIRLALAAAGSVIACVVAVDVSNTRLAVPFAIVVALAGVLIVLRCDREEDCPVTPTPPLHERTDVELRWTDDSRIAGYSRKAA